MLLACVGNILNKRTGQYHTYYFQAKIVQVNHTYTFLYTYTTAIVIVLFSYKNGAVQKKNAFNKNQTVLMCNCDVVIFVDGTEVQDTEFI
jgi:hypothetical protein